MLSASKTVVLLFIVALAIASGCNRRGSGKVAAAADDAAAIELAKPVFPTVRPAQVEALAITGAGVDVAIERAADGWRITSPVQDRADGRVIDAALRELSRIEFVAGVVATDRAQWAALGVSDEDAVAIDVKQSGRKLPTLYIGRKARVRVGTGEQVFAAYHISHFTFARQHIRFWRDRSVMRLSPSQVAALVIEHQSARPVTVRRVDGGDGGAKWQGKQRKPIDAEHVERFVRQMANLTAYDTLENPHIVGALDKPRYQLTLAAGDGTPLVVVRLWAGQAKFTAISVAGQSRVWLIKRHVADEIENTLRAWSR